MSGSVKNSEDKSKNFVHKKKNKEALLKEKAKIRLDKRIENMITNLKSKCEERKNKYKPKRLKDFMERTELESGIPSSKLHVKTINNWLKKRYFDRVKSLYLYYPHEVQKRLSLIAIFNKFDSNGDGTLEIDEFLDMFIQTYLNENYNTNQETIPDKTKDQEDEDEDEKEIKFEKNKQEISPEKQINGNFLFYIAQWLKNKIKIFYSFITSKDGLNLEEFIKVCINPEAMNFFMKTMIELNKLIQNNGKESLRFIPFSFDKMVHFLGEQAKREKLYEEFIQVKESSPLKAFEILKQLYITDLSAEEKEKIAQYKNKKLRKERMLKFEKKRRESKGKNFMEEILKDQEFNKNKINNKFSKLDFRKMKEPIDFLGYVSRASILATQLKKNLKRKALQNKFDEVVKNSKKAAKIECKETLEKAKSQISWNIDGNKVFSKQSTHCKTNSLKSIKNFSSCKNVVRQSKTPKVLSTHRSRPVINSSRVTQNEIKYSKGYQSSRKNINETKKFRYVTDNISSFLYNDSLVRFKPENYTPKNRVESFGKNIRNKTLIKDLNSNSNSKTFRVTRNVKPKLYKTGIGFQ